MMYSAINYHQTSSHPPLIILITTPETETLFSSHPCQLSHVMAYVTLTYIGKLFQNVVFNLSLQMIDWRGVAGVYQ